MRKWVGEVSPKWAQANLGDESSDEPRVYRPDPVLNDTGLDVDLEDLPPKRLRRRPRHLEDYVGSLSSSRDDTNVRHVSSHRFAG